MEDNLYRYSPLEWSREKLRNIWQVEFNQWNKIKCGLKIASFVSDVFAAVARSENSERQGYARLIWN